MTALLGQNEIVHFVGIGGIGMCGIAELLLARGYRVTGSDLSEGPTVKRLRQLGASISIGHAAAAIGNATLLVTSSAIRASNPEVVAATQAGIPIIPRAEMLARLMSERRGIAIAGTHGKTTTTALVAHLLQSAGLDPTIVVGGRFLHEGIEERSGAKLGQGEWLVAEADESDGSFLRLSPHIAAITNIETEHMDHYGNAEALENAFVNFANRIPDSGRMVLCIDDPGIRAIWPRMTSPITTISVESPANWRADNVTTFEQSMRFNAICDGKHLGTVQLSLIGEHNVSNALCALAVVEPLGIPFSIAQKALAEFPGMERRFETKGKCAGIWVVDDYAHHPTEIRATLAAARAVHTGRILVLFQPHRYTRTRDHFNEFAESFHNADSVWLTDIYAASEDPLPDIDSAELAKAIRKSGHPDVHFAPHWSDLVSALLPELREGDLVLTLGAGDIHRAGPLLLGELEKGKSC